MYIERGSEPGINTIHGNGLVAKLPTNASIKQVTASTRMAGINHDLCT